MATCEVFWLKEDVSEVKVINFGHIQTVTTWHWGVLASHEVFR